MSIQRGANLIKTYIFGEARETSLRQRDMPSSRKSGNDKSEAPTVQTPPAPAPAGDDELARAAAREEDVGGRLRGRPGQEQEKPMTTPCARCVWRMAHPNPKWEEYECVEGDVLHKDGSPCCEACRADNKRYERMMSLNVDHRLLFEMGRLGQRMPFFAVIGQGRFRLTNDYLLQLEPELIPRQCTSYGMLLLAIRDADMLWLEHLAVFQASKQQDLMQSLHTISSVLLFDQLK
ncbi:hypothetical protein GE09DRAFT_1064928 [Coniochaeta sp. 2T2.1]|nr:hypothetical protein GE09DRAFT_1064928 [Coniochaeta sp. 2T2.1]